MTATGPLVFVTSSAVPRNEDDVFQWSVMCPEVTQEPDSQSCPRCHSSVAAGLYCWTLGRSLFLCIDVRTYGYHPSLKIRVGPLLCRVETGNSNDHGHIHTYHPREPGSLLLITSVSIINTAGTTLSKTPH